MAAIGGTGAFQRLRQHRWLINNAQSLRRNGTVFATRSRGSSVSSRPLKSTPVPLSRSMSASEVRMCFRPVLSTQWRMLRLPTVQLIITGTLPANWVAR